MPHKTAVLPNHNFLFQKRSWTVNKKEKRKKSVLNQAFHQTLCLQDLVLNPRQHNFLLLGPACVLPPLLPELLRWSTIYHPIQRKAKIEIMYNREVSKRRTRKNGRRERAVEIPYSSLLPPILCRLNPSPSTMMVALPLTTPGQRQISLRPTGHINCGGARRGQAAR